MIVLADSARLCYRAFGLVIRSWLNLPELERCADNDEPEIEIELGCVPRELPAAVFRGSWFEAGAGALLVRVSGVARYLVCDGRRVTIEVENHASEAKIRAPLLTVVMGGLLHQRDELVLHGSGVLCGDGSIGFLGRSAAGKSTLAAGFRARGRTIVTDDLCVIRALADGRPAIQPSFPHLKLALDTLAHFSISTAGLCAIGDDTEKHAIPLTNDFAKKALPLRKLYVLRPSDVQQPTLVPIRGPAALAVLKNQTYRPQILAALGKKPRHFQRALDLAQQVPIVAVVRPKGNLRVEELVTLIEADLAGR